MNLSNITDEIYVLNLKKREDRLEHIKRQLSKINLDSYEVIESIDGSVIKNNTNLRNGMLGLIMTYLKIFEISKNKDGDSLIIIEDDCVFSKDFNEYLKNFMESVPSDWDMLYFGGNHNTHMGTENPEKINEFVVKVSNTYSAHCVVLKKDLFFDFINELKEFQTPNDVLLTKYQKIFNAYSTMKKITWQVNNHSDIEEKYTNYDWFLKN